MRGYYRRNAQRVREIALASRDRRIESVRAYDRARGFRPSSIEKMHARAAILRALRRGDVERKPCEVCGDAKVDAHHDDYSRPLVVRWLCRRHHMALHRAIA
jgi:ribosomal protein S27AE